MRDRKRLALTLIAFLFYLTVSAQGVKDEKIAVKLLKEDFNILRGKLESTQLGLYLYTSKDSLNKIFDRMSNSINEPMTPVEFYRRIAPINKTLRNLHTLFWASLGDEKRTATGLSRFPLDIHWADGRMYVLRDNSTQENVVAGSVIKSIN